MRLTDRQIEDIEKDIEGGWINKVNHKTLPLSILKYTKQTQFEYDWTPVRMFCRGIIVNDTYDVIALPFVKFFSHDEIPSLLKRKKYRLFDKIDGTCILAFFYDDKLITTTLDDFDSEQSMKVKKILLTKYIDFFKTMRKDRTYIFEFCSPEHKVVIDYKEDQLFLLGITDPQLGIECLDEYDDISNISKPKEYSTHWNNLLKNDLKDKEGYIILFEDGTRFKAKYDHYLKTDRLYYSPTQVWQAMKDGDINELVSSCPSEFDSELNELITHFEKRYNDVKREVVEIYKYLLHNYSDELIKNDDEYFSFIIRDYPARVKRLLFSINKEEQQTLDSKIWKQIKPKSKCI